MTAIYNIQIMSRSEATKYSYRDNNKENYIIISINEPFGKKNNFNRINRHIKDVLYLFFDDIAYEDGKHITMTNNDAALVKKFIDRWKDRVNNVIVHCHAGISRSSGVACAISRYLNGDDFNIWGQGSYTPNLLCYKLTCKAFGIDVTQEEIKYRTDLNWNAFEFWDESNGSIVSNMFIEKE